MLVFTGDKQGRVWSKVTALYYWGNSWLLLGEPGLLKEIF